MIPRRTADQAEREATRDGTYYGSTTTGSTPAIQQREIQPTPRPVAPSFDFSNAAMQERKWAAIEAASDQLRAAYAYQAATPGDGLLSMMQTDRYNIAVPEDTSVQDQTPKALANRAYLAYTMTLHDHRARNLAKYPSLLAAATEVGVDEKEVGRLIHVPEVENGSEKLLAALALIADGNDGTYYGSTTAFETDGPAPLPGVEDALRGEAISQRLPSMDEARAAEATRKARQALGNAQIEDIMRTANPVMQMAIWDVAIGKLEDLAQEIEAPGGTEASSWALWALNALGAWVEFAFSPLMWANDVSQQYLRAAAMGIEEARKEGPASLAKFAIPGVNTAAFTQAGITYWDKVSEGNYNPQIVDAVRREYGDLAVDLILSVEDKGRNGDHDPLISLFAERSGDPEAMQIIQQLLYNDGSSDIDLDKAARALENGNLANSGQSFVTSFAGDKDLGGTTRGHIAGLANVVITVGADPTIIGMKIRSTYVAARFTIEKIAPGASRFAIEDALQIRSVRRAFDGLFRDLNRYDELLKTDPGKAGILRDQISRRFPTLPDRVIDTLRTEKVRSTDELANWLENSNLMYQMQMGRVANSWKVFPPTDPTKTGAEYLSQFTPGAREGARLAARTAQDDVVALYPETFARAGALKRTPLLPRRSLAGVARMRFADAVSVAMPAKRGQKVIDDVYDNTSDTAEFVKRISSVENVARAGQIERAAIDQPGVVGRNLDRFYRMFASVGLGHVSIVDGRDAKKVYRFARNYLSRRHAAYWADHWRRADPGQRYLMIAGLNRTAAAAKGVNLADEMMLGRVDELITATRTNTSFSAKSPPLRPPGSKPIPQEEWTIPSRTADGVEEAQFLWQTASHVALPNIQDLDKLGRWQRMVDRFGATRWLLDAPQTVTDTWSLYTLFGLRYSTRNAIEDLWFYSVLTGGSFQELYKGRRMSTMLREARGRKRVRATKAAPGKPPKEVQALGMINRRMRTWGDHLEDSNKSLLNFMGKFIRGNLDQNEVAAAQAAAQKGNYQPMRRMAATAMARSRFAYLSDSDKAYLLDLVDGPFGLKMLDELAGTGRTASSGGFIDEAVQISGIANPGVGLGALPRSSQAGKLVPVGDYTPTLSLDGTLPEAFLYWERGINGVLRNDGPAGRIAVAWLDNPEEAVRRVAQEIRNDPTGQGYAVRFAALATKSPEAFAASKVQAVRAMFSDAQGNLNMALWRRVVSPDRTVRTTKELPDGKKRDLIDFAYLKSIPAAQRPTYVSGQQFGPVTYPQNLAAFFDRNWGWMGEQYARIAREPIFLANYLEHRKLLTQYQSQLAKELGDGAARKITARMAADRAYSFTLSYVDNPQNRSMLAYKMRNVSRYYRATEDFYRRVMRVGKNHPVGLWKTALLYDVLDDTGFVFTDDQGQKYFLYPGTGFAIEHMAKAYSFLTGTPMLDMPQPSVMGARINMLTPSWDPNQALPYLAGPFGTASYKLLARRFPTLGRLDRVFLGEYGDSKSGSNLDAVTSSFMPAGLMRILTTLDQDERDSMLASARADAVKMAVVNGLFPDDSTNPNDFQNSPAHAELIAALDVQAWSSVILRLAMSFVVPASPQRFNDNVTDFARRHRVVGLRPAFLKMVNKREAEGHENFLGMAEADWFALNPNLMPFTVSNTAWADKNVRPPISFAREVNDWVNNNTDLLKEYPDTAWYLAPQDAGFDFPTWNMILASGFRASKPLRNEDGTIGPLLRDLIAAEGRARHNATRADYQKDIDALDPRVPEQLEEKKQLINRRDEQLKQLRDENPWWDLQFRQTMNVADSMAQERLTQVKRMVDDLSGKMSPQEFEGSPVAFLSSAIYTYLDFAPEIQALGEDNESRERKRNLQYELRWYLGQIAEQSPHAELFINSVLESTNSISDNIGMLDLSRLGVDRG